MTSPTSAPRFVPCYDWEIHSPRESPEEIGSRCCSSLDDEQPECINLFGFMDHKQLQAQTSGCSCCRRSDERSSPGCRLAKPIGDSSSASLALAISVASVIHHRRTTESRTLSSSRARIAFKVALRRPAEHQRLPNEVFGRGVDYF